MAGATDNLLNALRRSIQEDPKRATILAVLVVVMLVMWARLALGGKSAPAQAEASMSAAATDIQAARSADNLQRRSFSAHAERLSEWIAQPVGPMGRNLFAVNLTYYRRDGSEASEKGAAGGFWDELAKSDAKQTDQRKSREILLENVRLQAGQIRLQSTMMSASPRAMVNGKLVGVGDVVAVETAEAVTAFRVLGIEARGMIVEHEGIRLEITMK